LVIADPILLLAAAAAAVDSEHQEDVKERHRTSSSSYEVTPGTETKPEPETLGKVDHNLPKIKVHEGVKLSFLSCSIGVTRSTVFRQGAFPY